MSRQKQKPSRKNRNVVDVRVIPMGPQHVHGVCEIEWFVQTRNWERPPYDAQSFKHKTSADQTFRAYVAVLPSSYTMAEEVLGWVGLTVLPSALSIDDIAVHPSSWRRGIGWKLVERVKLDLETSARKKVLHAIVYQDDMERRAFFTAQGFRFGGAARHDDSTSHVIYNYQPENDNG